MTVFNHLVTGDVHDRIHKIMPLVHILRRRNPVYPISLRHVFNIILQSTPVFLFVSFRFAYQNFVCSYITLFLMHEFA